jgi:hypothetical protein
METVSMRMNSIKTFIFFAQFFNTGLILLIVNANLSNQGIYFLDGKYTDFTKDWFDNIGGFFVETKIIQLFTPII